MDLGAVGTQREEVRRNLRNWRRRCAVVKRDMPIPADLYRELAGWADMYNQPTALFCALILGTWARNQTPIAWDVLLAYSKPRNHGQH